MPLSCLIFGAIGSLVETSDLQRQSYNAAFKNAGLDWDWTKDGYRELLKVNGGKNRVRHYAKTAGHSLSEAQVSAIHQDKTDIYERRVKTDGLQARAGISDVIKSAKRAGLVVGMASTTSPQNIDALFAAATDLAQSDFDFILSGHDVATVKPEPEIYEAAIRSSGCNASDILVIEDTAVSAQAAQNAGLQVVVYLGEMIAPMTADDGMTVITADRMTLEALSALSA